MCEHDAVVLLTVKGGLRSKFDQFVIVFNRLLMKLYYMYIQNSQKKLFSNIRFSRYTGLKMLKTPVRHIANE